MLCGPVLFSLYPRLVFVQCSVDVSKVQYQVAQRACRLFLRAQTAQPVCHSTSMKSRTQRTKVEMNLIMYKHLAKTNDFKKKSLEKRHIWMILRWIWLSRHSFQCSEGSMVDRTLSIWSLTSSPLFPQVRSFKCYVCRSRLSGYHSDFTNHKGHSLHFCCVLRTEIWQIWFICLSLPLSCWRSIATKSNSCPMQISKNTKDLKWISHVFLLNQH